MAANVPRVFNWFACMSDGRKGAPCPTTPAQGALTPAFLALAPGIQHHSGDYYEWCAPTKLPPAGGSSQDFKDGLWNLTARWVENFSMPLLRSAEQVSKHPSESEILI